MSPTQSRWPAPLLLKLRNRHFLFWDLIAMPLAAYLAFVLRLTSFDLGPYGPTALVAAVVALAVKPPIFGKMGGYGRYWPFASLPELELLVWAPLLGEGVSVVAGLILLAALGFQRMPWSVPVIELLLTVAFLAGPRFAVRMIYRAVTRRGATPKGTRRVLIAGAGEGGNLVVQELQRNPQLGLEPAGFVDDAPAKQGLTIRGVRVWGPISAIPRLVKQHQISRVLVAIPTATSAEMRTIVGVCHEAGVEVLTLPGVFELISGQVEIRRFRPVQVEDLLARDPVQTDTTGIHLLLAGKVVLITGAGGSIGSELCRQVAACEPERLVLVGHGENSIFHIERSLRAAYPDLTLTPVIADTRDAARLDRVFARTRPDVVIHAAAHKHVPLMEANPEEAIVNNVGGTRALLAASERAGVGTFVLISTDKAVNPTSVMGATKRIAEHLVQDAARRTGKRYVAVRFGNVLGSRGSVVPIFEEQIAAGGPVKVTHPEMTRYFMTIPEAVQLVLQATAIGKGGEVFVLDMGKPVKIVDLARDMIRLAGLKEDEDICIEFTGLRPGEKLFEEIFLDNEHHARTVHEKIYASRNGLAIHDAAWYVSLQERVDTLLAAATKGDTPRVLALVRDLVPECAPTFGCETAQGAVES